MKTSILVAALAVAALTTSCSNENNESSAFIKLNTSISSATTRVSTDNSGSEAFEEGDIITVYGWIGGVTNVSDLVINGVNNELTGGQWVATPQMLWTDMVTKHYFLSVYPARKIEDFGADLFTLAIPDEASNDLLIATNLTGLTATQNPVTLIFNHAMAKLVVNLTYRNQWSETPTVTAVSVNAAIEGAIDYLGSVPVKAVETKEDFNLVATTANTSYSSIMIPQDDFSQIQIIIDGQTFTYKNEGAISLVSGKVTTVNLIVGRDQVTAEQISITDWEEGETINGGEAL
jgi:hypothetical protein